MDERARRMAQAKRAEAKRRALRKKKTQHIVATTLTVVAALLLVALLPMAMNALLSRGLTGVVGGGGKSDPFAALPTTKPLPLSDVTAPPAILPTIQPTPSPSPTPVPTPEPTPVPTPEPVGGTRFVDPNKKMVAFTFDDGPSKLTLRILKAFEKVGGRATFFELGSMVDENPDITRQVYEAGHQIGTHTYDHYSLRKQTKAVMLDQVYRAAEAIERAAEGCKVDMLRPPYGNVNDLMRETIPMPFILWDVDSLDWKTRNTKKIVAEVNKGLKDGSIVLMHDLYETTAEAVEKLLPALKKKGYQFVTIDELFAARGIVPENGKSYFSARPSE